MTIKLTGEVVRPGDAGYEAARVGWNRLYSRYPAAIVFCNVTQDVVNAVEWARHEGIALRARSGRHSLDGWSSLDGGLVIDVSQMKSVTIDEAGGDSDGLERLTQKETVPALGQRGFGIPTGSEGGVGLGGVVLGGGFGLLTRAMGLASDNLLAAEIVVPDGARSAKVVQATEHINSDLLWACRGGGGGSPRHRDVLYVQKLHKLEHVEFAIVRWAGLEHLGEVLRTWQRDAPVADDVRPVRSRWDPTSVEMSAVLHGGSRQELNDGLRSLLAIGKPEVTYMSDAWPTIYQHVDRAPDLPFWKFYSHFVKRPFPDEAIELVVRYMADTPTAPGNFFCSSFGGAVRNAPSGGSAFPHRDALFYCEPGAAWDDPAQNAKAPGWAADFWRALRPLATAPTSTPNAAASDWAREYDSSNPGAAAPGKGQYDPENVFSFEQSVLRRRLIPHLLSTVAEMGLLPEAGCG